MKYTLAISFCFFLFSCIYINEKKSPKGHNPYNEINQNLENEEALEFYDKAHENYKNGNYKIAREYLKQSYKIEKSPIILNEFGLVGRSEKKYDEALSFFDKSISLDKTYYPSYINKSLIYSIQLNFIDAEKTLENMLDVCESDYWRAYANFILAVIYFNNKESCEKVLTYLNKSRKLKEDDDLKKQFLDTEQKIKQKCW